MHGGTYFRNFTVVNTKESNRTNDRIGPISSFLKTN